MTTMTTSKMTTTKRWPLLTVTIVVASCMAIMSRTATAAAVSSSSDEYEQCNGVPPQESVVNFMGMTIEYELADRICCHNHRYAEPRGYLEWEPDVALFDRIEEQQQKNGVVVDNTTETIFYDSVCGLPLFIAPRGRSYESFKSESIKHGWPSFRPEEMIAENVILHPDGRMESKCLTHLGHNLPEGGVDRYCIDLVCIAGAPLTMSNSALTQQFPSLLPALAGTEEHSDDEEQLEEESVAAAEIEVITSEQLNPETYQSTAEQNSGNVSHTVRNVSIGVIAAVVVIIAGGIFVYLHNNKNNAITAKKDAEDVCDDKTNENDEEAVSSSSSSTSSSNNI